MDAYRHSPFIHSAIKKFRSTSNRSSTLEKKDRKRKTISLKCRHHLNNKFINALLSSLDLFALVFHFLKIDTGSRAATSDSTGNTFQSSDMYLYVLLWKNDSTSIRDNNDRSDSSQLVTNVSLHSTLKSLTRTLGSGTSYSKMISLLLVISAVAAFYFYLTAHFRYWSDRGVLGPKPLPFLGNFPKSSIYLRNFIYELDDIYR